MPTTSCFCGIVVRMYFSDHSPPHFHVAYAGGATAVIAPRAKAAFPLDPYVVRVVFADGEMRDVDIEPLLDGPVLRPLWDKGLFERVFVDEDAGTIAWPNHVELDREVIYGLADAEGDCAPRITVPEHA